MSLAGKRVLVVEDEALVAMLIEDCLEVLGCELAGMAAELGSALSLAGSLPLDVAVLDVNLRGELSYAVAETLRRRGVPFLFATGYGVAGLPPSLHGAPVLAKPFALDQLREALLRATTGTA